MPTTTNFGWTTPADTDLVKDGAAAIRTLAGNIDTSLVDLKGGTTGQVLSKASGTDLDFSFITPSSGALTLIKTQTIGSAVSTVTVSDVFSSSYDTYKIILSGGAASGDCEIDMQLGATTTGYYNSMWTTDTTDGTVSAFQQANTSKFSGAGNGSADSLTAIMDISCPNLAKYTSVYSVSSRTGASRRTYHLNGQLQNTTQYTAFTFNFTDSRTVTGGTIKVYGYAN